MMETTMPSQLVRTRRGHRVAAHHEIVKLVRGEYRQQISEVRVAGHVP
jgi:hypothetical protein